MLDVELNSDQPGSQDEAPNGAPAERPRRRRAASRPAGPPKEVEVVDEVPTTVAAGTATVESTSTKASTDEAVIAEPSATDAQAEPAARPVRRRATRKAGTPKPVEAPVEVPQTEAAQTGTAEPQPEPVMAAEPAEQPATEQPGTEKPARARRSRSRKQAEASVLPDEPQATEQAPRGADQDVDAALAAVTAAATERPRRSRRVSRSVANPFVAPNAQVDENGELDAQAVLDSLAASIAQGDAPSLPEETQDEAPQIEVLPESDEEETEDTEAADEEDSEDTDSDDFDSEESDSDDSNSDDSDSDDSDSDDSEDSDSDDDSTPSTRRRRRRRGGRRRRRSGSDEGDNEDSDESANDESSNDSDDEAEERPRSRRRRGGQSASTSESTEDSADQSDDSGNDDDRQSDDNPDDDADGGSEGGRRRRRRRRRRGEDAGGAEDDPSDVVVRVREPRRIRTAAQTNEEVTGIEGSTRMEAKKQRRREGRAAGRRRAPILSEAEFLARRESVNRRMVIRQNDEYTQLAVLEDDVLVEHYVDRASATSLIGNVYLGRVQNVLPSMEAAFIDIGRGRNAVLYAGEIDWAHFGATGEQKKVENVLKSGQTVLVQVSKDPVGAKGARLTSHISLPGRYVVYSPGGHLSGISRKLADSERHRLKDILGELIDDDASVIVRTAAEGASEEELVRDVNRLKAQWEIIEKKAKQGSAPQQLYAEPDLTVRIVRDLFTEDFTELVVSGNGGPEDAYEAIDGYVTHVAPHLAERLTRWDAASQGDPFAKNHIDDQIAKALERKVFLPSGGSLVIDRTEAMTVIDVNTGKFTGAGGNLEATVTSNNLEAAEEVVRQLRLRDIGGIIVVDFIDMVLPNNRELLLRRLVECLGRDRTRHQVAEVTSLGLVQMTRKKIGTGLAEAFTEECTECGGRGYTRHDHPVETQAPADGGDRHHGGGGGGGRRGGRKH